MSKFPFCRQLDQMDCGPACLQMVANFYKRPYSLVELRRKTFITREGVSLLGLSEAAEGIGFRTVGLKLSFDKLDEVPLPAIAHWYQRHFVVIHKIKRNKIFVADPGIGLISYSVNEFKKGWLNREAEEIETGVVLSLEPLPAFYENEPTEAVNRKRASLYYLLNYVKGNEKFFIQLLLGLLTGSLIQLIIPFLTQSVVDIGINTQNIQFIYLVLSGQMMLYISRSALDFIRRWILLHLSTRLNISLISDFLSKLYRLPISFFEVRMIGDILKRIEDHSRIEKFISTSSLNILFSFFNIVVFGTVLMIYNKPIFLIFGAFSLAYVLFVLLFQKRRSELDYKRYQQMADTQNSLIQTVQGMSEIKINNSETRKRWEWERLQASLFKINIASAKLQQIQDGASLFLNETKNLIITVMAALAVIDGSMTVGMMLAVQYIVGQMNVPVNEFILFSRDLQDAKISLDRISEIHLQENEEDVDKIGLVNSRGSNILGTIALQNVDFRYDETNSNKILDGINLTIPEGKVTAIVGPSGSGKTTLLKLLLKFYKPQKGKITVGTTDIDQINASLIRQHCGVVMQDGYLFSDTIAGNISMSDDVLDPEKLLHAVKVANIKEFIESLPLGYKTKIGMNGVGLSQGQKQRLLIARAVYKNPQVIFFDEATSALDANNEKVVLENLNEFFRGRTVIIIAHRLSTVKNADQVAVLENGKVVEIGTHLELASAKGKYFELIKNQLEIGT